MLPSRFDTQSNDNGNIYVKEEIDDEMMYGRSAMGSDSLAEGHGSCSRLDVDIISSSIELDSVSEF